jgi:hypothetical protein
MFGNLDKAKAHEFPAELAKEGQVVVFQQRLREVTGKKFELISHPMPIQTIPVKQFRQLYPIPPGAENNGFAQLGLFVTPLHDPSQQATEPEEDFDLPKGPVAETATTSKEEIIKEAVEAVENGSGKTAAEDFTDRANARDEAESGDAEGESEDTTETVEEAKEDQKAATEKATKKSSDAAKKADQKK